MLKLTILCIACSQALWMSVASSAEKISTGNELISLDEMVVTTRKREETLQEVPIAITAFSSQQIKDANIQDLDDVALLTPGLTYSQIFGNVGNPVIRGMNTTIGEPNVGIFIDGVYQESRQAMEMLMGDEIERIEVAKGPQSALYGRNTFAGAINYVTKQPANKPESEIELTMGNKGRRDARISNSGSITEDTLFYRVGAMHSGFDGFYTNEQTGDNLDTKQSNIYSLSLLALPTDDIQITFRLGVEDSNDGDDAMQFVGNNAGFTTNFFIPPGTPGLLSGARFNDFQYYQGKLPSLTSGYGLTPGYHDRDNVMSSFRLDWDLDNVTITAITGYNHLRLDEQYDTDYSAGNIRFRKSKTSQNEFSQELRLTSVDQPIRWMAGVYIYRLGQDIMKNDAYVPGAVLGPLATVLSPSVLTAGDNSTLNGALFGSTGIDLTKQWALTLSGRYSYEKKKVNVSDTFLDGSSAGSVGHFQDAASFTNFMPKAALDYKINADAMVYASVAKAVKSGGFNTETLSGRLPTADERKYNEEKSWNYELGTKTSWLGHRLTVNLAAFYIKWDNQIVRALGQNFAILNANAGSSTSKGFELELAAKPAKNWDISGGLSYTDAKFDKYTFGALAQLGLNPVLDGNRMQYVSKWTVNASTQYVLPAVVSGFDWKTRVDVMYQSKQSGISIDNPPLIPSRTLVNFRTGLENKKYRFDFWVKNLFNNDKPLSAVAIPNPAQAENYGLTSAGFQQFNALVQGPAERTFGVTASMKF